MSNDNVKFKGTIARCVYSSPGFKTYAITVSKEDYPFIKFSKYGDATIIGDLSDLIVGVEYDVVAKEEHTKYGYSYRVVSIRRDIPTDEENTRVFLEEILTPNQAKTLYENYPNIVDLVMSGEDYKVDLSKLQGIGESRFNTVKNKIIENFKLVDLVSEFKGVISLNMLTKIYYRYPDIDVLRAKLKEEPYTTLTRISGVGFKTADAIILELQKENIINFDYDIETSKDRCLAYVIYLLEQNEDEGNTKMNLSDLRSECIKTIPSSADNFLEAIKSKHIFYDKTNMSVGLSQSYKAECYIAETITSNIYARDVWCYDVEKYRTAGQFLLSDEQMNAVKNVCRYNISILNGSAGCVDCDTEFFNGTEWKRIADYKDGDSVLQYNENGTAELVKPLAYIMQPAEYLWHFKTKYGLDQCLSDNHNCYYITSKGNLYHKTFKEIRENHDKSGFVGKFITSFNYSGGGIDLSDDEIRLMIAVFADGSFYERDNCGDRVYKQARFHIKKNRKKKRLIEIINSIGLSYKKTKSATKGYDDYYVDVPFRAKHYPKDWYMCNKHQLEIIADEVMHWDGNYKRHNNYSTTCKEDADFIQFVYTSLGYRATISINDRRGEEYLTCGKTYTRKSIEYSVVYTSRNIVGMCADKRKNHKKTEILPYKTTDGYEYCFTVPSHMLVLRRNNKIFITGNCGKSFTTQAMINMLKDNGKSFILMSPTGKASKVISEYTGENAYTIHRGLCYSPMHGWYFNKDNKLPYDVVIVDEFSMCDTRLFTHLIDAIDFEQTRLVIIGDNAQLPSVGAGNLLHDFMESAIIPTTTLTKIFRYSDGGLMKVATDTRFCKPYLDKTMKNRTTSFGTNKDYIFIDMVSENIPKYAVALYKKLISMGNNPEDVQVLAAKNVGDCGTIMLNNMIQKAINKNYGSDRFMRSGDISYYDGDLVIQTQNNYRAIMCDEKYEVMKDDKIGVLTAFVANGETGFIKCACKDYVVIDFDGIDVKYSREDMGAVKLGYSITTHKSQGSSIKNVILCTPKSHMFMLNSNLIYVAITRTINKCFHLGDVRTVNISVKKKDNLTRNTFLSDILKERSKKWLRKINAN